MEYVIIVIGIVAILFRKQITSFKNRIQPDIPKKVRDKASSEEVGDTRKGVVTVQEITTVVVGALFVIFGILAKLGIIHMKS